MRCRQKCMFISDRREIEETCAGKLKGAKCAASAAATFPTAGFDRLSKVCAELLRMNAKSYTFECFKLFSCRSYTFQPDNKKNIYI